MVLQLWAAGGATVLAIRDRFILSPVPTCRVPLAGLVTFLALMGTAGEQTLGWSMLAMAVVTCAWMLAGLRRSGGLAGGRSKSSFTVRAIGANAGLILGRTAIYLAFNVLFVITLAFASHQRREAPQSCPTPTCSPAIWSPVPEWPSACRTSPT